VKDFQQLGIHADVAFRIVRFWTIVLGCLDADHAFVPLERGPGQHIDFVAAKARHRCEEKDLVLFGVIDREFLPCAFQERSHVEGRTVAGDTHLLYLEAGKRARLGKLHNVTNPRDDILSEE
jgi:hypothetical protein